MYKNKKIVLVGDSATGKTSIVSKYINDIFNPYLNATIGAAFSSLRMVAKDGTTDTVEIWDTAGQERYRSLVPMYYRETAGALIVYDVNVPDGLTKAHEWIKDIRQHAPQNIKIYLIGNKYDLLTPAKILETPHIKYSSGIPHYYSSAKTGKNINNLFLDLISDIPRQPINTEPLVSITNNSRLCC
jgi:small GTP-binding protein